MRVIEFYLPKLSSKFELSRCFDDDLSIYGYVTSIWTNPQYAYYYENNIISTIYYVTGKV